MQKKKTAKKTAKVTKKIVTKKVSAEKTVIKPVVQKVLAPAVTPVHVKSDPEKIWDEIKHVRLDMFGLPGQVVEVYYKPMYLDDKKLHLSAKTKATSALSALETAIGSKYTVELADRFVVVTLITPKQ